VSKLVSYVNSILVVNDKTIEVDNEGYLLFPDVWNKDVALELAKTIDIDMDEPKWEVVNMVRNLFEETQCVPEARKILKILRERHGKEIGTRKYLYKMFPYGYGQQACKIAGMRKPLKLLLDL